MQDYAQVCKTIRIKSMELNFIEIDFGNYNPDSYQFYLKKSIYGKVICSTSDLNENWCKKYVDSYSRKIGWRLDGDDSKLEKITLFRNYEKQVPTPVTFLFNTAIDSFKSLLVKEGLDIKNKNYLIFEK